MEKWFVKNIKADLDLLSKEVGVNKLLCRLMVNRNLGSSKEMDSFIEPSLDKLHNPFLMADMDIAVKMILDSIDNKEKIRISKMIVLRYYMKWQNILQNSFLILFKILLMKATFTKIVMTIVFLLVNMKI